VRKAFPVPGHSGLRRSATETQEMDYCDATDKNSSPSFRDENMTDDPLKHSKAELRAASRAIESMKRSDSMDRFESEWREFLTCLEKVWTKVERTCQPHRNTFQPWQGQFQALRKKDMLLRYLKQARDADNHSIQDMTEIKPGETTLNLVNRGGGYIQNLEIRNGQIVSYQGDPMVLKTTFPHPIAVPIQNNGVWYNPPTSHLGRPVLNLHPVTLADLGIAFYSDFVGQAEGKFFIND